MDVPVRERDVAADGTISNPAIRRIGRREARLRLSEIPRLAPVVSVLGARDFKVKFKQSLLGPLWLLVQPLALLAAFAIGFGAVAEVETSGVPYPLFSLAALSAWTFFQVTANMGALSLVSNYALVTRTACPRAALPLASVVTNLPALAIPTVLALGMTIALGEASFRLLLLPVAALWLFALTAGLGLLLSAVAARFRDVPAAMPFLLQIGIFASPVGYSINGFTRSEQALIGLNPLAGLLECWRWSMIESAPLPEAAVAISALSTVVVVVIGWLVFRRLEPTLADFI